MFGKDSVPLRTLARKTSGMISIEQIEEMIHTQELTLEQRQHSFADEKVYQNHKKLTQLQADVDTEQQKLNTLYEAWEYRCL